MTFKASFWRSCAKEANSWNLYIFIAQRREFKCFQFTFRKQASFDVTEALVVILYSAELLWEGKENVETHLSHCRRSKYIKSSLFLFCLARGAGKGAHSKKRFSEYEMIFLLDFFPCEQKWKPRQRNQKKTKTDLGTFSIHGGGLPSSGRRKYKTTFCAHQSKK